MRVTKHEVNIAGDWPRTRQIYSHLDRKSLVNKGFIIWLSREFFSRDKAGTPERARWNYPIRVANHSAQLSSSHGACHAIKLSKAKYHLWYLMPRPRATVPELFSEYLENGVVHV